MGRAEKDELAEFPPPLAARLLAIGAGASRDEAAHTMADDDEIFDFDRPCGDERLERLGKCAAIDGDVQA